jgi:hypothetical protein
MSIKIIKLPLFKKKITNIQALVKFYEIDKNTHAYAAWKATILCRDLALRNA